MSPFRIPLHRQRARIRQLPITASYEITVLAGADKTELVELITEYSKTNPKFYTEE